MTTDASTPLPADLHRALEQAVGNANNAADVSKKKKSKRVRDEDSVADVASGDVPNAKKKKKSRSHTHGEVPSGERETSASVTAEGDGEAESSGEPSKKKKKSKKGKEKETAEEATQDVSETQPTDRSSSVDLATSSADFLNAVVAAASATSGQPPTQPPYDPSMPPPAHFLPYPPQHPEFGQYNYPPPPGHLPPYNANAHGQAPPPMLPDFNGLPPELNFASSEDLLRTLQEFDLSKVMHVLRSLGDAANAANVSVTMPPQVGPPLAPPPVVNKPVRSEAILGQPPRQRRPPQAQGQESAPIPPPAHMPPHAAPVPPPMVAPMAHPPPPPPPSQEGNPEHAHMLANVWMNAQKLAEMVKKEGKIFESTRTRGLSNSPPSTGLVYKKGKFSAIEEAQLNAAIEHYRVVSAEAVHMSSSHVELGKRLDARAAQRAHLLERTGQRYLLARD